MFENMAERFPEFDGNEIQEVKENAENQNTKKSTKAWVSVWLSWAESKGYNRDIVSYEAKQLDEKLENYGSEYEPDSLRVMLEFMHEFMTVWEYYIWTLITCCKKANHLHTTAIKYGATKKWKFLASHYKQIMAWFLRGIWHKYRS